MVIWYLAYIYIGKSSAYSTNRATYSGQKHRHLPKFISLVPPDRYVLDTIGRFRSNMNDASVAQHILHTFDRLIGWCKNDGVMIVDRGCWNVIDTFLEIGYEPKMPAFLRKGQTEHTTEEANKS